MARVGKSVYERIWSKAEKPISLLIRYHSRASGSKKGDGHRGILKRLPEVIEAGYRSPTFRATVCVGHEGIELAGVRIDDLLSAESSRTMRMQLCPTRLQFRERARARAFLEPLDDALCVLGR